MLQIGAHDKNRHDAWKAVSSAAEETLAAFKDHLPESLADTQRLSSGSDFEKDTMNLLDADKTLYDVLQYHKTEQSTHEAE